MATKTATQKRYNGSLWDTIYPITLGQNIYGNSTNSTTPLLDSNDNIDGAYLSNYVKKTEAPIKKITLPFNRPTDGSEIQWYKIFTSTKSPTSWWGRSALFELYQNGYYGNQSLMGKVSINFHLQNNGEYNSSNTCIKSMGTPIISDIVFVVVFTNSRQIAEVWCRNEMWDTPLEIREIYNYQIDISIEDTKSVNDMATYLQTYPYATLDTSMQLLTYELYHANNSGGTLLWTNPSPNAKFRDTSAITISDMSNYAYIVIEYKDYYTDTGTIFKKVRKTIGASVNLNGSSSAVWNRTMTLTSATSVTFGNGSVTGNGSTTSSTSYSIPVRIYGTNIL